MYVKTHTFEERRGLIQGVFLNEGFLNTVLFSYLFKKRHPIEGVLAKSVLEGGFVKKKKP